MTWAPFPYPDARYRYTAARLKKAWSGLHAGDVEPWPGDAALVSAWTAFHAGEFEQAQHAGLALGFDGHVVANKASCVHAVYLEQSATEKRARLLAVAGRCESQQAREPRNPAAFYWHAYALGRYAQEVSVIEALAQGIGGKVKASLDATLALAPAHADAHVALGVYHAEIIDKIGALVARLTYGATRADAIAHFKAALALNPGSAIARVEYARALSMLDGHAGETEAAALRGAAARAEAHDAMERLDIERARQDLGE
jgi:hypothetical protein